MSESLPSAESGEGRCPSMPPGMHPVMQALVGAQYHRCRLDSDHDLPHVNAEGFTWTRPTSPVAGRDPLEGPPDGGCGGCGNWPEHCVCPTPPGQGDAPCLICRRPEHEHRDRNSHRYVTSPAPSDPEASA